MSISAMKWALVAVAICLLAAIALPSQAAADCCICTACEGAAPLCLTVAGCDFEGCADRCQTAGCGTNMLNFSECGAFPVCATAVGAPAAGSGMLLSSMLLLITLGGFALRRRSLPMPVRAASLVAIIIASAAAIDAITQIQLSGHWQGDTTAATESEKQWRANLVVGRDGSLSGTVELTGFGNVNVANVEGTLVDGVTSGTLRAPDGAAIAQFQGSGDAHAVQGTFTKTQNGGTGTFSWSSDS